MENTEMETLREKQGKLPETELDNNNNNNNNNKKKKKKKKKKKLHHKIHGKLENGIAAMGRSSCRSENPKRYLPGMLIFPLFITMIRFLL